MKFYNLKFLAVLITISLQLSVGSNKAFALDSQDWADIIEIGTIILGSDTGNDSDGSLERDVNSDEGDLGVNGGHKNGFPCMGDLNTMCLTEKPTGANALALHVCKLENREKVIVGHVNATLHKIVSEPVDKREQEARRFLKNSTNSLNVAKRQPMHEPLRKHSIHLIAERKFNHCTLKYAVSRFRMGNLRPWDPDKESDSNSASSQSNSDSSSQSNNNANKQATASQSNQTSSNKPKPDPMGEMGDILGAVTPQQRSSNSDDISKKKLNEAIDQSNNAHDNKDYAKSIAAIKIILADSKNIPLKAAATNRLAEYYKYGRGVSKDEVKAQALFEQASVAGDADADAHICQNYEAGTGGVTKNHQTAIKYCTAAANKGNVDAMSKLGYLYHAGIDTINPQLGNEWICKAAKQGESTAIRNAEKLKLNCN